MLYRVVPYQMERPLRMMMTVDEIALLTLIPNQKFSPFPNLEQTPEPKKTSPIQCFLIKHKQDDTMEAIFKFLITAELPDLPNLQAKRRFFSKAGEFFLYNLRMYKKNGNRPPLLVIMDSRHKNSILLHAHENLGHRGIYAVLEVIWNRFYWPNMQADINHDVK